MQIYAHAPLHDKYTTRSVNAERRTRTYTRTHDDGYNARATHADRRTCTHTRIHVQDTLHGAAQAECRAARTHTVPHAHTWKVWCSNSNLNFERTSRPGRQYAAAQYRTESTRPFPGLVRTLYTRVPHWHVPMNTHVRSYVHCRRNPRAD